MEWQVVTVIVALVGLVTAIVAPLIRLNTSITKLTVTLDQALERLAKQEENSHASHKRIWDKNKEQDKRLNDHEKRISFIERK